MPPSRPSQCPSLPQCLHPRNTLLDCLRPRSTSSPAMHNSWLWPAIWAGRPQESTRRECENTTNTTSTMSSEYRVPRVHSLSSSSCRVAAVVEDSLALQQKLRALPPRWTVRVRRLDLRLGTQGLTRLAYLRQHTMFFLGKLYRCRMD